MHWMNWGGGWIFMILWWVLVALAIFALIKWLSERGYSSQKEDSALEVLKKRYARGEIERDEFEQKKKDLT